MSSKKGRVLSTNRLVHSPHYPEILDEYNLRFKEGSGKVNNSKFYREMVRPLIHNYSQAAFYKFINTFKTRHGLKAADNLSVQETEAGVIKSSEDNTVREMVSVQEATEKGLALMLNIGLTRLKDIRDNPHLITAKEAAKLIPIAMKAQDSRIGALSKLSEEGRKVNEAKQNALTNAAYSEEIIS